MWSKFSQQLSQAVSEKPNSLVECKWSKQERVGGPWSHIGPPLLTCVIWLKAKNHPRSKNHQTFWPVWNLRICFGRSKALKTRLQSTETDKEVKEKWHLQAADIIICSLNSGGRFKLYIVYNSDVSTDHAVTLVYMNLAQLTWCEMLLCIWERWLWSLLTVKNPAMAPSRWLHSAVWRPAYWAENISKPSLLCYGSRSHSKTSKDCELSGTGHLQSSYKGATEKVHSVCFQ